MRPSEVTPGNYFFYVGDSPAMRKKWSTFNFFLKVDLDDTLFLRNLQDHKIEYLVCEARFEGYDDYCIFGSKEDLSAAKILY